MRVISSGRLSHGTFTLDNETLTKCPTLELGTMYFSLGVSDTLRTALATGRTVSSSARTTITLHYGSLKGCPNGRKPKWEPEWE
jgi:hypothetical protein